MTEKHKHPKHRLGKRSFVYDKRTLKLRELLKKKVVPVLPASYNFDRYRRPFPMKVWGNDQYGDCVVAARANQFLRWERIEHRVTMHLTDEQVVQKYKDLTGCQSPGDSRDVGLNMLATNKDWRNGWQLTFDNRKEDTYKISAFASVFGDMGMIKASIRYFAGCQLGLWLPLTAISQTEEGGTWDVVPNAGASGTPGSWGGHAVLAIGYTSDNELEILTWGMKMKITEQFMNTYGDEAWATVDDLDSWTKSHWLDVPALKERLAEITS